MQVWLPYIQHYTFPLLPHTILTLNFSTHDSCFFRSWFADEFARFFSHKTLTHFALTKPLHSLNEIKNFFPHSLFYVSGPIHNSDPSFTQIQLNLSSPKFSDIYNFSLYSRLPFRNYSHIILALSSFLLLSFTSVTKFTQPGFPSNNISNRPFPRFYHSFLSTNILALRLFRSNPKNFFHPIFCFVYVSLRFCIF